MKKSFLRFWRNYFFPPTCIGCGELINTARCERPGDDCLCEKCRLLWEEAKRERCPECALHVSHCLCSEGFDRRSKRINASLPKLIFYHPEKSCIQDRIILSIKRRDDLRIFEFLSDELAVSLCRLLREEGSSPDECLFTWTPRKASAVGKYGFDQAQRLARGLALTVGSKRNCRRLFLRRGGREQKKLDAEGRRENAERALRLRKRAARIADGRTVVIVDDLVTTGATLNTAARLLADAGARHVLCVAVARDMPTEK